MKSKVKKLCCLIPALILLVCIISAPAILFPIFDRNLYADNHPLSKVDFSLSSEISDIPLVYRIHDLLGSYYGREQDAGTGESASIVLQTEEQAEATKESTLEAEKWVDVEEVPSLVAEPEFEELTQYESLNRILQTITGEAEFQCTLKQPYDDYVTNMVSTTLVYNEKIHVQYIYDSESEKILRLSVPKVEGKELNSELKRKAMEEFITYLNLDILEDWYDNGDSLISNKAHLSLFFQENEEQWILGFSII